MRRTQTVRPGEELDWRSLDRFLQRKLPGIGPGPRISQYPAGKSNLTYRLQYPGADLVVRRPPFGSTVRSAHNMYREYRVMQALGPVYGSVPEVLVYSDDESIVGAEFYVMRRVPGQVATGRHLPSAWNFTPAETRRFCIGFWKKLVELHRVDFVAAGLQGFGRPEGYERRQVEGWNSRMRAAATADGETFDDVQAWLLANLPGNAPAAAILHGDYRLDNIILDEENPFIIVAVLDWEISALGNPLMDLGNALAYWVEADDPAYLQTLMMQPSAAPGMLSRQEILELYAAESGLDVTGFNFYYTYGMFRNMSILQQIYFRYRHGKTKDRRFEPFGALVQALGNHCRQLID